MEGKRVKTSKNPILKRFRKTFSLENLVDASSDENANKVEGTSGDLKNNRKNQSTARNDNESMRGRCFSASSNLDGPNHQGALYLRAKQENSLMVLKLAKMEQQLHEALERNKSLQENLNRYQDEHLRITSNMHQLIQQLVEKGDAIEKKKNEIVHLTTKLQKEQEKTKFLYAELEKAKALTSDMKNIENGKIHGDEILSSSHNEGIGEIAEELRKSSMTAIGDLMLSCTLCQTKINVQDMEAHSLKCSSKLKNGKNKSSTGGMLVATVTCSSTDTYRPESTYFKITCKTTIPEYSKPQLVSERTRGDLQWLRKALEDLHPERVIPPLTLTDDLTANLREIQRFLSRICYHKVFKKEPLVRSFFTYTSKDLDRLKVTFEKQCPTYLPNKKPAIEVVDKEGLLYRTQVYFATVIENLEAIVKYLKENNNETFIDELSQSLLSLSKSEPNNTYLKTVAKGLSSIIGELENKKNVIYDESVFVEDLESILDFIKCADELLYRIECSINTFLYWEEEVKVFEEMKDEGLVTTTNGKDITHKWAEASQNCCRAKEELEHMCLNLSEELSLFDIRKEQELKQIFIEYAQSRCDIFEKLKSKWFGVKLMMDIDIVKDVRAVDFHAR